MKTLLILCLLLSGCAYKGDVLIYSPGGNVDKAVSVDAEVSALP